MIECYVCGKMFEPKPDKLKAWAESDRNFEPTDWECPDCIAFEDEVDLWAYGVIEMSFPEDGDDGFIGL